MPKPVERTISYNARQSSVRKIISWVKLLDHDCYVHEVRTFSCQKTAKFHIGFVVYRWIITLLFLGIFATTLFDLAKTPGHKRNAIFYLKYFIYMTNLVLTLLAVQTTFGAIIVTMAILMYENRNPRFTDVKVKWLDFIYWKLHVLSVDAILVITLGYWLIVDKHRTYPLDGNNILAHVVSGVLAITDWLVTGLPHNLSDAWMGWLGMLCYFIFTVVYWFAGGMPRPTPNETEAKHRAIYISCTNYKDAKPILCMLYMISIFCAVHVLLCVLYIVLRKIRPKNLAVAGRHS